jgi:hypothetical protein
MVLNRIGENNFTMIEKDSKYKPYMLLIQFGKNTDFQTSAENDNNRLWTLTLQAFVNCFPTTYWEDR